MEIKMIRKILPSNTLKQWFWDIEEKEDKD